MTTTKKNNILIIPDVHGRTFWKSAVQDASYEKVVFLGDYFDPYERERITEEKAYMNFAEILKYKKDNSEQVVLLLGNHDMHYFSEQFCALACGSRYCEEYAGIMQNLFAGYEKYFKLAHEETLNETRFLFTHAGVVFSWYKRHYDKIRELTAENLNHLLATKKGVSALAEISKLRCGRQPSGSIVWADVDEMLTSQPFPGVYQIFGHTFNPYGPLITDHYACLDCRKAFLLDEKEQLHEV